MLSLVCSNRTYLKRLQAGWQELQIILVQKVLKTVQLYESEPVNTIRDMLLQAEKKNLIEQAEIMFELRLFRNEIAHDYLPKSQISIIEACIHYTPFLLVNVDKAMVYCKKYF